MKSMVFIYESIYTDDNKVKKFYDFFVAGNSKLRFLLYHIFDDCLQKI